jgi:hypothetical protein
LPRLEDWAERWRGGPLLAVISELAALLAVIRELAGELRDRDRVAVADCGKSVVIMN